MRAGVPGLRGLSHAEGLNAQVYNRCVGTRYCGNNCPYMSAGSTGSTTSGRRRWTSSSIPTSTVRAARRHGEVHDVRPAHRRRARTARATRAAPVRDGEIQTACQQTCPTQAITFGNLKDGQSARVASSRTSPRGYHVLDELGTRPGVTYLKKVVRSGARVSRRQGGTRRDPRTAAHLRRARTTDLRRRQPRRPPHARARRATPTSPGCASSRLILAGGSLPGPARSASAWAWPASARPRCGRCTSRPSCSGSASDTRAR